MISVTVTLVSLIVIWASGMTYRFAAPFPHLIRCPMWAWFGGVIAVFIT